MTANTVKAYQAAMCMMRRWCNKVLFYFGLQGSKIGFRSIYERLYLQAQMYAGSLFIQQMLGWNIYASTAVILAITAIYTLGGKGLKVACRDT